MTWEDAEKLVAGIVPGGQVVTARDAQLRDIDVVDADGDTYSVKLQKAAARYHNVSFEMELAAEDGSTIQGNFARCLADHCVVVIPWTEGDEVLCWDTRKLKAFLADKKYPLKGLTFAAVQSNEGRKYRFAQNLIVPVSHLRAIVEWVKLFPRSDA